MDYCELGSLQKMCDHRHLTCREAIKYTLQFLNGLHAVHTKGFIHFDIKPSNILIGQNRSALLSDFGLAKHSDMNGFAVPLALYDAHRPPESLLAEQLTTLADIYQSGVTMYRICNGENIYLHQLRGHVNLLDAIRRGTFPDRNCYLPHIPNQLRRIINKAMHADPSKRFQSVLDFQNALSGITDTTNLDWQLRVIQGTSYHWTRETVSHIIYFSTELYNNYFSSSCYKTNKNTSITRRIMSACRGSIPRDEWNNFCTEQLLTIN